MKKPDKPEKPEKKVTPTPMTSISFAPEVKVKPKPPAPTPAPASAPAPVTSGTIDFNTEIVHVGESYTVNGFDFDAGTQVTVNAQYDDGAILGFDATVDGNGWFGGLIRAANPGTGGVKHEVLVDGVVIASKILTVE